MRASEFAVKALLRGLLIVAPIYVAILLLLKGMGSLMKLVQPVAKLLPDWLPAEQALSLLLVLFVFFLVGVLSYTRFGQSMENGLEKHVLHRLPGYKTVRSLTERLVGETQDQGWKPALAEIEEALVRIALANKSFAGYYDTTNQAVSDVENSLFTNMTGSLPSGISLLRFERGSYSQPHPPISIEPVGGHRTVSRRHPPGC